MTSQSVLPSTNSRTMPTFSSEPRKAVMFLWRVTVVYTRSSARNWVVTSLALDCISPLISSWTTLGFLTTHLKSSEAEPAAHGGRFCVGLGGAQ